jgi:hypothetical protein
MKKHTAFILVFLTFFLTSCLTTTSRMHWDLMNEPDKISGTYDLILIGGAYNDDPDRIAIFDVPGDGYEFKPVTEEYRVKRIPGLSDQEALTKAKDFFAEHCAYNGFITRKLNLPEKGQIGFELVPDYPALLCEEGNEIFVSYGKEKNGVIKVYTSLMIKSLHDRWRKATH